MASAALAAGKITSYSHLIGATLETSLKVLPPSSNSKESVILSQSGADSCSLEGRIPENVKLGKSIFNLLCSRSAPGSCRCCLHPFPPRERCGNHSFQFSA